MDGRILFVLTSHSALGNTDNPTGWYLPEVAHTYYAFKKAGFKIDVISPNGGKTPMDPSSATAFKDDEECKKFLKDDEAQALVNNTKMANQVSASDYSAVFYPGGHGPMFDLASNERIAKLAVKVYEQGGVVGAVCHGTVGLVPMRLSDGESLLKGKTVTSFTNSEEDAVQLSSVMPFMLETRLKELGATFKSADNFQSFVCASGRVITGQNPASSKETANAIISALKDKP